MNWIENVLIIAGVSLDIFAAMECQGALVAKVDKKQLSVICALIWRSGTICPVSFTEMSWHTMRIL